MNPLLPATAVACLLLSACTGGPGRVAVDQRLINGAGGNVISAGGGNLIGGAGGNLAASAKSAPSAPAATIALPTTVRLAMPKAIAPAATVLAAPGPDLATSLRDNLAYYHEPARRIDALLAAVAKAKPTAGQTVKLEDPDAPEHELTVLLEKKAGQGVLAIRDKQTQVLGLTFTSAQAGRAVLRQDRHHFATDFDLAAREVDADLALETATQTLVSRWTMAGEAKAFTLEAATFVHRPAEAARDGLVVFSAAFLDDGSGAYRYGGKTAATGDRLLFLSRDGQWVEPTDAAPQGFYLDTAGQDLPEEHTSTAQRAAVPAAELTGPFPTSPLDADPFEATAFTFPD